MHVLPSIPVESAAAFAFMFESVQKRAIDKMYPVVELSFIATTSTPTWGSIRDVFNHEMKCQSKVK